MNPADPREPEASLADAGLVAKGTVVPPVPVAGGAADRRVFGRT